MKSFSVSFVEDYSIKNVLSLLSLASLAKSELMQYLPYSAGARVFM